MEYLVNVYPNTCASEPNRKAVPLSDVIDRDSPMYEPAKANLRDHGRYWHSGDLLLTLVR